MDIVTDSLRPAAYTFYLVSTSPLISTMSANASKDLYGATVTCRDGFTNAALEDAIIMCGIYKN